MRISSMFRVFILGFFGLIVVSAITAFAANLTLERSNIDYASRSVSANDLKPAWCTQGLADIVSGSGSITGTSGNDLIIGSSGSDTINGLGGDDCIIGGGGTDTIDGGDGTDACGMGTGNTYTNCESLH